MKAVGYLAFVFLGAAVICAPCYAEEKPPVVQNRTVAELYPGTASGALTFARPGNLPKDVLLRAETVEIGKADLEKAMAGARYAPTEQLQEFPFFTLEHEATPRLLLVLARKGRNQTDASVQEPQESDMIAAHLREAAAGVTVMDDEISAYYERIKDMVGVPLSEIKDRIRAELEREKQETAIDEYIRTLGKRIDIVVSAPWVREQAKLAGNNPIGQARTSGKPTVAAFSSGSCCGPDIAAPLLDELRTEYGDTLNIVHVDARSEPLLMARHGIRSIPTFILYDKNGNEIARQIGAMNPEDVAKLVPKAEK